MLHVHEVGNLLEENVTLNVPKDSSSQTMVARSVTTVVVHVMVCIYFMDDYVHRLVFLVLAPML